MNYYGMFEVFSMGILDIHKVLKGVEGGIINSWRELDVLWVVKGKGVGGNY